MEIIKKIKGYNRNLIRLLSTNRNNGYNVNRIINEIEKEKKCELSIRNVIMPASISLSNCNHNVDWDSCMFIYNKYYKEWLNSDNSLRKFGTPTLPKIKNENNTKANSYYQKSTNKSEANNTSSLFDIYAHNEKKNNDNDGIVTLTTMNRFANKNEPFNNSMNEIIINGEDIHENDGFFRPLKKIQDDMLSRKKSKENSRELNIVSKMKGFNDLHFSKDNINNSLFIKKNNEDDLATFEVLWGAHESEIESSIENISVTVQYLQEVLLIESEDFYIKE